MTKKQHFAIVPDRLIAKRDPKRLQIYCDLYMMEVSNQSYNLRHFAKDKKISYSIAYSLLRIVRDTLGSSRKKKDSHKQSKDSHKKNTKNNRYEVEEHEAEQLKNTKNKQKAKNNQQTNDKQAQYHVEPEGISDALQLQLESELETNELTGEKNILSRSELMSMRESDRNEYVSRNYDALKKAGII
tara:strand:+ start:185 stop:742 length:558 start_codon:yes stop_codon:yes gene_type:complete